MHLQSCELTAISMVLVIAARRANRYRILFISIVYITLCVVIQLIFKYQSKELSRLIQVQNFTLIQLITLQFDNTVNNFYTQTDMQRQELTRTSSKTLITSQMYTHSKIDTTQHSVQKSLGRKHSSTGMNNFLNFDKLVEDVKITQIKQNKYSFHIVNIMKQLEILKQVPHVKDEIVTIELLLDTINKKVTSNCGSYSGERKLQSSVKKSTGRETSRRQEINTPIRDIDDTSCIVYTKFSLRDMIDISHRTSVATFEPQFSLQTPRKLTAEQHSNREMDKLNNQILLLEKMLKNKGVQGRYQGEKVHAKADQNTIKISNSSSKLPAYKNSQILCGPMRKTLIDKYKWNNSKENITQCGKQKTVQSKFR